MVLSREEMPKLSHTELFEAYALSLALNQKHEALIEAQADDIAQLKEQFNQLRRLIFGVKSERFIPTESSPGQLSLFTDPMDEQAQPAEKPQQMLVKESKRVNLIQQINRDYNYSKTQIISNGNKLLSNQISIGPTWYVSAKK
jgi:hypothetical protein